jgi:hypothetical protein
MLQLLLPFPLEWWCCCSHSRLGDGGAAAIPAWVMLLLLSFPLE